MNKHTVSIGASAMQLTAAMRLLTTGLHDFKKNNARTKPILADGLCSGATCWTRTNDPPGQKQCRAASLTRSHRSVFLPAQGLPASATGGGRP